jgi:tRNA (cmo5U34)-methyltransferase
MEEVTDRTMPSGPWRFDADVTDAFADMLARSIPQYEVMRRAVFDLGSRYVRPSTDVVDLGASRGEALDPFVRRFGAYNRHVAVEVSGPMREALKERFAGYLPSGVVTVRDDDLRHAFPPVKASLILSVLTLQFVPIEHRQRLVQKVYDHLLPGGAAIVVEKVLGATAGLDEAFVDVYYALKRENGYSQDAIDRKRLSLEGVLVPVTASWNEELLRMAGFREVDCFWRWANFAGWIAVRR